MLVPLSLVPGRVVVVIDDAGERAAVRRFLQQRGHEVFEARDGVIGLWSILTVHPVAAVVDVAAAELDGYSVAASVKSAGVDCVLVAVSSHGGRDVVSKALDAGFDRLLTRPFHLRGLAGVLGDTGSTPPTSVAA